MKKRITALLLSGLMLLTIVSPAAMAEETTIHIRTAEQLRALAENCIKESYSLRASASIPYQASAAFLTAKVIPYII